LTITLQKSFNQALKVNKAIFLQVSLLSIYLPTLFHEKLQPKIKQMTQQHPANTNLQTSKW